MLFIVLSTAIVGIAQTQNSVSHILNRFEHDTEEIFSASREATDKRRAPILFPLLKFFTLEKRISGDLRIWQLDKFDDWTNNNHKGVKFFAFRFFLSITIAVVPAITAIWVFWRTLTEGFGYHLVTQASFFIFWLFSVTNDWILSKYTGRIKSHDIACSQQIYWITFVKDFLLTIGAIIAFTCSAIRVFNSCNRWTKWFSNDFSS